MFSKVKRKKCDAHTLSKYNVRPHSHIFLGERETVWCTYTLSKYNMRPHSHIFLGEREKCDARTLSKYNVRPHTHIFFYRTRKNEIYTPLGHWTSRLVNTNLATSLKYFKSFKCIVHAFHSGAIMMKFCECNSQCFQLVGHCVIKWACDVRRQCPNNFGHSSKAISFLFFFYSHGRHYLVST